MEFGPIDLIQLGVLMLSVIGAVYRFGHMKGVQDQQNERIIRLEERYNGQQGSD